ncbi:MAG TPA: LptA/OstA family protein [Dongiaceae bacterium]|jgi:lipopolysaccharide export system protein LptA|nr:LptA/OstA family protein [Dongiaceae bacterium]
MKGRMIAAIVGLVGLARLSLAQDPPAPPAPLPNQAHAVQSHGDDLFGDSHEDINVTSEGGLEWLRDRHIYIARQNAVATRGKSSITGDMLTAFYDDSDKHLKRLLAEGHVTIHDGDTVSSGERADYDADRKWIRLTGREIKSETSDSTLTATRSLDYWSDPMVAVADGGGRVVQSDNTITANHLVIYFRKDPAQNDKRVAFQIEGTGDAHVLTAKGQATASKVVHNIDQDFTLLTGNVHLWENGRETFGERAEINNKTGISKVLGAGKPVRANIKSNDNPSPANPPATP